VHERLRFPQEQLAKQGRIKELDEPAYRCELISESDSQWCPGGLTRSQKRRVQSLRHKEQLEIEAKTGKVWHPKRKANEPGTSADIIWSSSCPQYIGVNRMKRMKKKLLNIWFCTLSKHALTS
jgi:hypothetical protein